MRILRSRRKRTKRLHRLPGNGNRGCPVARRQRWDARRELAMHRNQGMSFRKGQGPAAHSCPANGIARPTRSNRRMISAKPETDVGATVKTRPPPPRAAARPRRPAPAERVVIVPVAALKRRIAPRIARDEDVAVARRPHPIAVAIGIEACIGGLIRRPDFALPRHVVPVPVCVQVVPRRVVAVAKRVCRTRPRCTFRRQHLVAVGVPCIPRIRLDRFRNIVLASHCGAQGYAFAPGQIKRLRTGMVRISAYKVRAAREDGQLARRGVQVYSHKGCACGRYM